MLDDLAHFLDFSLEHEHDQEQEQEQEHCDTLQHSLFISFYVILCPFVFFSLLFLFLLFKKGQISIKNVHCELLYHHNQAATQNFFSLVRVHERWKKAKKNLTHILKLKAIRKTHFHPNTHASIHNKQTHALNLLCLF